ncbi:MAG: nucleoside triphosphate pyrophosphohydrolase [Desulfamplus sp.]|nr:nucleoside triphosphate pyrophosphohydrolase [Desulfamplus sp.]MBF0390511.1 nucleoside triphosphate pyrophosphohydrolase [Desulfamplus sp.]
MNKGQECGQYREATKEKASLFALIEIIQKLRGENGCPWDKKQTPETIWKCLAEELYELLAAIQDDDYDEICEELGDVLFQILFIAEIYREKRAFDIKKSIDLIAQKMIRRHPHIYAKTTVNSEEELWANWESIKKGEKAQKNGANSISKASFSSILDSVPVGMPALMRSYKISERAVRAGFDWKDIDEVILKTSEELEEFKAALITGNKDDIAMEFGDILFTLTNVARLAGVHPEVALTSSISKFEKRFRYMEKVLFERGLSLKDVSRKELESLWDSAKTIKSL